MTSKPEHERNRILNSEDVFTIMREILMREEKIDPDAEHFWVIGLSANNGLLCIELVSTGDTKRAVQPMDVFSLALQKRAVKMMLVRNQAGGKMQRTEADDDITDRLIQVGLIVGITVLDHIIMTSETYMSFQDMGLMEALRASKKYVPHFVEEDRIKAEATKIGDERGMKTGLEEDERAKAITIAKAMLAEKKFTPKQIAERTGLSEEEVQGLNS